MECAGREIRHIGNFSTPDFTEFRLFGLFPVTGYEIFDAYRVVLHGPYQTETPLHAAIIEHQAGRRYEHRRAVRTGIDQELDITNGQSDIDRNRPVAALALDGDRQSVA